MGRRRSVTKQALLCHQSDDGYGWASEHEKAGALAEARLGKAKDRLSRYSLQSLWPINKPHAAGQTDVEKEARIRILRNLRNL